MPNLNGIDLYKQIKQNTLVIFITSRPDYAVEGFNLNALDYLLKPFTFERFKQAIRLVIILQLLIIKKHNIFL